MCLILNLSSNKAHRAYKRRGGRTLKIDQKVVNRQLDLPEKKYVLLLFYLWGNHREIIKYRRFSLKIFINMVVYKSTFFPSYLPFTLHQLLNCTQCARKHHNPVLSCKTFAKVAEDIMYYFINKCKRSQVSANSF